MIAIVDYGMGNLRSVEKALAFVGAQACITEDVAQVQAASHVVLPGVGAFGDAMARLRETGMDVAVCTAVAAGKPVLGICLGMQLLFAGSDEGGEHAGLGLIPARITRIPEGPKVPHMGWNSLSPRPCALFEGLPQAPFVYFVHSYHAADIADWTAATADYGSVFTAAIAKGNLFGTQFHPEKSGDVGLRMLRNFAAMGGGAAC